MFIFFPLNANDDYVIHNIFTLVSTTHEQILIYRVRDLRLLFNFRLIQEVVQKD